MKTDLAESTDNSSILRVQMNKQSPQLVAVSQSGGTRSLVKAVDGETVV